MKLHRMTGLAAVVMALANPVAAQDANKFAAGTRGNAAAVAQALEMAMTPGPGQARLEPMVGTFNVKIRSWVAPNKPPVESTAVAVSVWVLGHRYIQSMLSGYVLNEPFDGIGYTAYDNVSKTYQTAWMDSGSTGMTWYRGGFDGATKSARMKATVPNALTGKPTPLELRLSILDNGDHMTELWGQGHGTAMFKMMELRYTRAKP
jgi:Protein of unknown function (DUF1579)